MTPEPPDSAIEELRRTVARLRAPGGCPWDREQTHASLRGSLLEEAHETVEAINTGNPALLREELGDLLLQVVMHAEIASESGGFDFDAVAAEVNEKLIRRHPHVFGGADAADSDAVIRQWEAIKREERHRKGGPQERSALDGVSTALPALLYAEKIGKRAARVGFDWPEPRPILDKIREETAEVEAVLAGEPGEDGENRAQRLEEELGDLLFAVTNLTRQTGVEPEVALRRATGKFAARFRAMEALAGAAGRSLGDYSLMEMEALWEQVKAG